MRGLLRSPGPLIGVLCFALVSIGLTSLVAHTLSRSADVATMRLTAVFSDAAGVRAGDDVRIAGVRVGRVVGTHLDGDDAEVTIDVDRSQQLTSTTTASLNFLNLMGQRYVGLAAGATGGTPLTSGDRIPLDQTTPALDLTAMFNAFKPLFDAIRPADVNSLADNLVKVLQGEGPTIRGLLHQTATLTNTIADRDQIIGSVLDNLTVVMQTTAAHRDTLRTLITDLGDLTHGLAVDRQAIGASIDSLQQLSSVTAGLVHDAAPGLQRDIDHLDAYTAFLAGNAGLIGSAVAGIPTQLAVYLRSLGYGSYLNVYVCNLKFQMAGSPKEELPIPDKHTPRCQKGTSR